ncbi:MAG: hypothetical protein ACHQE5_06945, partial [Actinomycetes bacterium]
WGMATRRSREAALSDLVAGLLDARVDPATERFDAELAAAEEDGRLDPQTAKVLRWWQREALRALVEHARVVLPPTLLALEQAAAGADREAEASAASWARAVAEEGDPDGGTPPGGGRRSTERDHGVPTVWRPSEVDVRDSTGDEAGAEDTEDAEDTEGAEDAEDAADLDRPADAADDSPEPPLTPPADLSEHRRRLLVAGLTRVRSNSH